MVARNALFSWLTLGLAIAGPSTAQRPAQTGVTAPRRVTIVLMDHLARANDAAMIQRTAPPNEALVIQLASEAISIELLALSLGTASRLEREFAGAARAEFHVPLRARYPRAPDNERERAANVLSVLLAADVQEVRGVGRGRTVTVPLHWR